MNPHYNQSYTREQIIAVLQIIHDCVRKSHFIISKNEHRQENINFINEYNLTSKRQKEILLKIKPDDFCHTLQNKKFKFEHEVLYVFCPQVLLFNFEGVAETVAVYTKFNIIDLNEGKRVVVISFHKRNKPIDYLFR
jgi:hypothetical protein